MRGERIVGGMMGHGMMGSGMMGAMGFWSLLWVLLGLALFALLVAGIVWLARRPGVPGAGPAAHVGPDPVQILKRRYAAGEIDDGEYERRLSLLSR